MAVRAAALPPGGFAFEAGIVSGFKAVAGFEDDLGGAGAANLDEVVAARFEIFLNFSGKWFRPEFIGFPLVVQTG